MIHTETDPAAVRASSHLRRMRIDTDLAALQREAYGKSWAGVAWGPDVLQVDFCEVDAGHIALQCQVRCAGFTFELQFVDPTALLDLGATLAPEVPAFVQRAAVMHAAEGLLTSLERCVGARIEVVGLGGPAPAWPSHTALGLRARRDATGNAGSPVLLRALEPEGWRWLRRATGALAITPGAPDPVLDVTLCLDPVPVTLAELRHIAAGDVLLLQDSAAPPGSPRAVDVSMQIGRVPLPGVRATRSGRQLRIVQLAPGSALRLAGLLPPSPPPDPQPSTPTHTMNSSDAEGGLPTATLDAIQLDVKLELGSIRLPLSSLRALAVGQVHEADAALDAETVVLWCGGQRLGLGRLVDVGGGLGVRIVALDPQADVRQTP